MRARSPARRTGCVLLGGLLLLCPAAVCGQTVAGGTPAVSKTLSLSIPVARRQAVTVSTEFVQMASFPKTFAEELSVKPSWRFAAVPITLGYSYALTDADRRIVPVVGIGVSYYFSQTRRFDASGVDVGRVYDEADAARYGVQRGLGMGYGAQATLGLRADVTRHLFVLAQGRARYVNGLAFAARHPDNLGAEFTRLDFAVGLGFKF